MSTTSTAISGMHLAQGMIAQAANNLANANTHGFKASLVEAANVQNMNGVSFWTRNTIDEKGSLEYTGNVLDLATDNNRSFFIVQNNLTSEKVNVATGSFRPNVDGQLEYLGKYVLLGNQYNEDGTLNSTLTPITINSNERSEAIATTTVTEDFTLNASLLAKGQASFVMNPSGFTNTSGGPTVNATDILVPTTESGVVAGDGLYINVQEEKNGQVVSNVIRCILQPATASNTFTSASTDISAGAPTDQMSISYNGVSVQILRSNIAATGTTNGVVLSKLADELNRMGLTANLVANGATSQIIISAPNATDALTISGTLATSLGITANVLPQQPGAVRFSSMNDLRDQLSSIFSEIDSNSGSSLSNSLLFIARPNTNVSFGSLQSNNSILTALGIYPGPAMGQGYDPYDINSNIASGNARADVTSSVALYDSLGNTHMANVALKRVADGWIQEVYMASPNELKDARSDGLIQVSKFTFDTKGALKSSAAVAPTVVTSGVSDPFGPIIGATAGVDSFSVGGQTFTFNIVAGASNFTSLADLAAAINSSAANQSVQATIIKDSQGLYRLKLMSQSGIAAPSATSNMSAVTVPDTAMTLLPDASQPLTIKFIDEQGVDPIVIKFGYDQLSQLAVDNISGGVSANGMQSSSLSNFSISANGDLVGVFSSGQRKKLYNIPLASYRNVNGLQVVGDNALKASASSGAPEEKTLGGNGAVLSGNLENSNVEQVEELTTLVTAKQLYNMNTKSWQTGNAIIDYLLNASGSI